MENITIFILLLVLSSNFLVFTLGADIRMKSRLLGPTITFGILQLVMFMSGWGLARLIAPLLDQSTFVVYQAIILFIGAKRIFRSITIKSQNRYYEIVHVVDAVMLSVAVGVDTLIMGLGFGAVEIGFGKSIGLLFPLTLLMALTGIGIKRQWDDKNNGRFVELTSGIIMFALGIIVMITI